MFFGNISNGKTVKILNNFIESGFRTTGEGIIFYAILYGVFLIWKLE